MKSPLVSVIITTKNEAAVIERLLKSIKAQSYKNIEILVVDNGSTDKTKKISLRYTSKVYDFGPERSAQRNYGAKKARGEYLLILDADMELSKEVIKECVQAIKQKNSHGAVIIPEKSVSKRFWEKVKGFERSFYNEKGDPVTDAARFFLNKAFKQVGGYDLSITGPEDWDLPESVKKLGYTTTRINSVILHYERIASLFTLFRKKYYYGLRAHSYLSKHKISIVSSKTIYFLRPIFFQDLNKLFGNPLLTISMFFMLFIEMLGGGLGYLVGRFKKL